MKFRKMMGCIALGLTCAMIGAGATMAAAEAVTAANSTTTVVTSPFTAAVQQVRNSVVGVSNYQTVRYGSYGNNFYFGYGFGFFGIFRVMQRNIASALCKSNGSLRTDSAGRTCYKYFFHHINTR